MRTGRLWVVCCLVVACGSRTLHRNAPRVIRRGFDGDTIAIHVYPDGCNVEIATRSAKRLGFLMREGCGATVSDVACEIYFLEGWSFVSDGTYRKLGILPDACALACAQDQTSVDVRCGDVHWRDVGREGSALREDSDRRRE